MKKVKVRRQKFDGITQAYGIFMGHELEFEVSADRSHFFVQLGYEIIPIEEKPKKKKKENK